MLFHSFSSGSLKTFREDSLSWPERKIRQFQRSLIFCVRLPLYVVGLIDLGVKASITRPCLVVFFVVCSKRCKIRFVLLTLQRYADISG